MIKDDAKREDNPQKVQANIDFLRRFGHRTPSARYTPPLDLPSQNSAVEIVRPFFPKQETGVMSNLT